MRNEDWIPVAVRVTGDAPGEEPITLCTRGGLNAMEDGWQLRYDEIEPDGTGVVHTQLICQGGRVTSLRTGAANVTFVFTPGEVSACDYQTEAGALALQVYTLQADARRREGTGRVRLRYQLSAGGQQAMRWLEVTFSPCKP